MNQRRPKMVAPRNNGSERVDTMTLKKFFTNTKEILHDLGDENGAFYFEQLEEHLIRGGKITSSKSDIKYILGL